MGLNKELARVLLINFMDNFFLAITYMWEGGIIIFSD